jgi:FMN phosphatase YigB (HAD superfamily)
MTINQILIDLENEKSKIKANKRDITHELNQNTEFKEAKEELRLSREVVTHIKEKLINDSPALLDKWKEVQAAKEKIKELKEALYASVIVSDRESGEQIELGLIF